MNPSFKDILIEGKKQLVRGFDWLFPHRCFECRQVDHPQAILNLCVFCWEKAFRPQRIIFSHYPDCLIYSSGNYEHLLKRILILSKFSHHSIGIELLTCFVQKTFEKIHDPIDMITFVPSYYHRTLKRGVDLPALLAFELSKSTGIEFRTDVLKKKRLAKRQSLLSRALRLKNTTKLFQASSEVKGKNVLVVDDILTTGSTALACYKALRRRKPASVRFLTAARTT